MDNNQERTIKYLNRAVTRRQAIKAGGIAAVGLAFSKPLIETLYPKPAFANYVAKGCTPGFWKTHKEFYWPIPKATTLGSVFNFGSPVDITIQALSGDSFQTALQYGGGSTLVKKAQILLRAAAAAYLNALNFGTYYLSPTEVVSQVNAALASGNASTIINLATDLDDKNNDSECLFLRAG